MWNHRYIGQNRQGIMLLLLPIILTCVAGDNIKRPSFQHSDKPALHELRIFPVGDKQSIDVVTQIAGQDYNKFGRRILKDVTVNEVSSGKYGDPKDIVVEILRQWLQGKGRQPITWQTFVKCLQDSGLNVLADCINSVITSASPHSSQCDLQVMDMQQPILEYSKVLKITYEMLNVTDPGHWLNISMPFIDLTLTEGDNTGKGLHGSNDLSLDEIANSITDGSKLLMEGRPGVGKTTLLKHIAQQWAVGNFLQRFSLVILLRLGHINSSRITNLENMLGYLSPDQDTASVARELGHTGGKGICFLLDAIDEYTPQSPEADDYVYKLIEGDDTLPNAAMIVTSRVNYLISEQHFTRKIVVVGFLKHQIKQYINDSKFLPDCFNFHTNVKDLSYLPLHLAMVRYLANQSEEISLGLDTDTKLYHMFVNLTFRHEQRYRGEEDFDELHSQAFSVVSNASFNATPSIGHPMPVTAFQVLDGKEKSPLLELHNHLFWKRIMESYRILSINRQYKHYEIVFAFTFSHHTFQDFFAAYHLTTLPYKEQIEMMESPVSSFYPYLIWKFFFGLLRDRSSENSTKLFQKFSEIYSTKLGGDDYALLTCAYELKQPAIADILAQSLNHSIILKRYALQHPSDCAAIGYAISLNPFQFKRLAISYTVFHPEQWEACFLSICDQLPENNTVAHVTFDRLELSDRTASAAIKLLQHFPYLQQLELLDILGSSSILTSATELEGLKHLRHLEISSLDTMSETIAVLSSTLTSLNHLEHLGLSGLRIDVVKQLIHKNLELSDLSRNPPLLQTLNLTRTEIGDDEIEALTEIVKHLTSLCKLDLSLNAIGDRGIAKLAEETNHLISLEALDLSDNNIGDEGAANLANSLRNLTSLQVLKLHSNTIGNNGTLALAEGIKCLTSLQELDLSNNMIGDLGVAKLAEETKHLSSLKRLYLNGNKIGHEGRTKLLEAVKTGWTGLAFLRSNTTYFNHDLVDIRSQNAAYNYLYIRSQNVTYKIIAILPTGLVLLLPLSLHLYDSVWFLLRSVLDTIEKHDLQLCLGPIILGVLLLVYVVLVVLYYILLGLWWPLYVISVVLYCVMFGLLVYAMLVMLFYIIMLGLGRNVSIYCAMFGSLVYVMLVLLFYIIHVLWKKIPVGGLYT